jgi:hypothetical protein
MVELCPGGVAGKILRIDLDEVSRVVPSSQESVPQGQEPRLQALRGLDPQAVGPLQEV